MRLHILGTAAARPWPDAQPSSVLLTRGGTSVLIDCGEGTLVRLPPKQLSQRGLDAVCVSHLHGDHVYGLPGLLTSMTLAGRTRALTLLGPPRLRAYLEGVFAATEAHLGFELHYPPLPEAATPEPVWRARDLEIRSLPLRHRVVAFGFCVSTPDTGRRLRPGALEEHGLPYAIVPDLRAGLDATLPDGGVLPNAALTLPPPPTHSFAYLTDTAPLDAWPAALPPPTVLLHDATFSTADAALAEKTGHSTVTQAAAFAKTAGAGALLLTHRSVRYGPEEAAAMREAAASVFGETRWACDGEEVVIG